MKRLMRSGVAAILAATIAGAAPAAVFHLQYTTTADSLSPAITTDATLTTDDKEFYGDGYLVLSITGTRNGIAIDGLADPFSEIFYPGSPGYVDSFGITFTAGGFAYNLARNNPEFYYEFETPADDLFGIGQGRVVLNRDISLTPATAAAVPEPAAWAMLIGGFGLIGGAMRSARTRRTDLARVRA